MNRWPVVAGVALAAATLLTACGGGSSYQPSYAGPPAATATGQPTTTVPNVRPTTRRPVQNTTLPSTLVGSWSGDDRDGIGSWTITFTADGHYRMTNERRGAQIDGRATASASRLMFQPATGQAYTVSWSVSGGRLSLNGDVYLRTGGGSGTSALAGRWMSLKNLYRTVTFTTDGRYAIEDPVNGGETGTYSVAGSRLTVTARGGNAITYGWSVEDGFLRLRRSDGSVAEFTRAG